MSKSKILSIGVGGCGGNVITEIEKKFSAHMDCLFINTDAESLKTNKCSSKLLVGNNLTKGFGAKGDPDIGRKAAIEDKEAITSIISQYDTVLLIAGMGGGTGTGASSFIAELAKEKEVLTIAVVTEPTNIEGEKREAVAHKGINDLQKYAFCVEVISNEDAISSCDKDVSTSEFFRVVDNRIVTAIARYLP